MIGDFRGSSAMGLTEVLGGLPATVASFARIMRRVRDSPPTAAALVNYTEYNLRFGAPPSRARGSRSVVRGPPSLGVAKRRTPRVARAVDRMAVVLPFEEPIWARRGGRRSLRRAPRSRHGAARRDGGARAPGTRPFRRPQLPFFPGVDRTRCGGSPPRCSTPSGRLRQRRARAVRMIMRGRSMARPRSG